MYIRLKIFLIIKGILNSLCIFSPVLINIIWPYTSVTMSVDSDIFLYKFFYLGAFGYNKCSQGLLILNLLFSLLGFFQHGIAFRLLVLRSICIIYTVDNTVWFFSLPYRIPVMQAPLGALRTSWQYNHCPTGSRPLSYLHRLPLRWTAPPKVSQQLLIYMTFRFSFCGKKIAP